MHQAPGLLLGELVSWEMLQGQLSRKRGRQGWEGTGQKSTFLRERIISDLWKSGDETTL